MDLLGSMIDTIKSLAGSTAAAPDISSPREEMLLALMAQVLYAHEDLASAGEAPSAELFAAFDAAMDAVRTEVEAARRAARQKQGG